MTVLSDLDDVVVPDRWSQITDRATRPEVDLVTLDPGDRPGRRPAPAAAVLALVLLVAGVVASRSGRDETVTADTTPPAPGAVERDERLPLSAGVFEEPILVDDGIGRAALLGWIWIEILAWPGDPTWEDVDGSTRATHPDTRRTLTLSVVPDGDGWAVVALSGEIGIRPLLDDDARLAGFARLGPQSPEVDTVEVLEVTSPADPRPLPIRDWDDEAIELVDPIEAGAADSYLVVTRDERGEAIDVGGWAFGRPDRLDLDLDAVLSEPGVPDPISIPFVADVDLGGRLERPRRFTSVWPGVDAYLSPLEDRSALCLTLVEPDTSASRTCAYATDFNERGIKIGSQTEGEDPWFVLVVPESTSLGDLGDATVHPSGIVVAWTGGGTAQAVADRLQLVDGILGRGPGDPPEGAPTETTLDGAFAGFGHDEPITWSVPTRGSTSGMCENLQAEERITAHRLDRPSVVAADDPEVLGRVVAGPDGRVAVHSNCNPRPLHVGRTDSEGRLDVEPVTELGDFVQHDSLRFTPDGRLTVIRRVASEGFRAELVSLDLDTGAVTVLFDATTVLPGDPSALTDAAVLADGTLVVRAGRGITIGDVQVASTGASSFRTDGSDTVWVHVNGDGVQQFDARGRPIGSFHPDSGFVALSPTGRWQLLTPAVPLDEVSATSVLLRDGLEVARLDHPGEFAEAIADDGTVVLTDLETGSTRLVTQ
ncbi:MAG: hypothetical protein AAGF02_10865 [Actinomycetota bacterium]